jgi:uncharacterized protein YjiS (DUF1127 family)
MEGNSHSQYWVQGAVNVTNASNGPAPSHVHAQRETGTMLTAFLFDTIGRYLRYRSQLASVYELDDRTLLDIGLNRGELKATSWDLVH